MLGNTGRAAVAFAGAAGSRELGAGLAGGAGGEPHPRFEIVLACVDLDRRIDGAAGAIDAERARDGRTSFEELCLEVARSAAAEGDP